METKRIIFLDVDGPLNTSTNIHMRRVKGEPTSSYYIKIPEDKIVRLMRIVKATNAELIMSSSWRLGFSKNIPSKSYVNLNNQLNRYGIHLSGWTGTNYERHRGIEISDWLENYRFKNGYIPPYIIIDDEIIDLIDMHRGHVIKTTPLLGLTEELVNISINVLMNQVSQK